MASVREFAKHALLHGANFNLPLMNNPPQEWRRSERSQRNTMLNIGKWFKSFRKKVAVQITGEPAIPVTELAAHFAAKFEPRQAVVIRAEIAAITAVKGTLLAVEDVVARRIDTKLGELNEELGRVPNDLLYPRIDVAALTAQERWSKSASSYAPCYAVFSARRPGCFVRATGKRGTITEYQTGHIEVAVKFDQSELMTVTPRLRKSLEAKSRSMLVGAAANAEAKLGLAAEFGVCVPPAIRTLVGELLAQNAFTELYFITAAPNWYVGPPEACTSVQPGATLLVGLAHNQFWLVKEFETLAVPAF